MRHWDHVNASRQKGHKQYFVILQKSQNKNSVHFFRILLTNIIIVLLYKHDKLIDSHNNNISKWYSKKIY